MTNMVFSCGRYCLAVADIVVAVWFVADMVALQKFHSSEGSTERKFLVQWLVRSESST